MRISGTLDWLKRSPWRGKRGLCRHPPGRDHAAHVRLRGAARPRDWTTQRQEVVGWCQGAAGHANQYAEQVGKRHGLERVWKALNRAIRRSKTTTVGWRRGVSKRRVWTFLTRLWGIV